MSHKVAEETFHFNPRLHEGGDEAEEKLHGPFLISIHASMKEATALEGYLGGLRDNFNPRLHEGGDI